MELALANKYKEEADRIEEEKLIAQQVELDEEAKLGESISVLGVAGRGGDSTYKKAERFSNFLMVYGTTPANQVKLETNMVKNILHHIRNRQDKVLKTVEFPGVLDKIDADDATFELSVSNTIERLRLFHRSSIYPK